MSWGMSNYLPSLDLPAPSGTADQLRKMAVKHASAPAGTLKADKSNTRERRMAIQRPPSDLKVVVPPSPRPGPASPPSKFPAASTSTAATRMSTATSRFSVAKSLSMYSTDSFILSTAPTSPASDFGMLPPAVPTRSPLRGASAAKVTNSRASFATFIESYTLRDLVDSPTDVPPVPALPPTTPNRTSKREHALLELLNTERSYASDLALIRDVHIPVARGASSQSPRAPAVFPLCERLTPSTGQPAPFPVGSTASAANTPESSRSSTFTASSTSSDASAHGAPMTKQDIQIIFSNVPELALFAEVFSDKLEVALGDVINGGRGKDRVGALFLEVVRATLCSMLDFLLTTTRSQKWIPSTRHTSPDIRLRSRI